MYILQKLMLLLGGITLFLFGLKFMSENMEKISGRQIKNMLYSCTKNRFSSVLTGVFSTAILQSSVATNIIIIGFVSSGILSFFSASAIVMGTNIGTTITAQLVSLSNGNFIDMTSVGAITCFLGFVLTFLKSKKLYHTGYIMAGFGMLFMGLHVVNDCVRFFKNFEFFNNLFLVDNEFVLFLNGLVITMIVQSSSAVTSIMIILAGNGLLTFEGSMFLILGTNIGTCSAVILASLNKSVEARRTACFNLAFNVFGSLITFLPILLFKTQIALSFESFSGGIERQIANFHTLFNVLTTIIILPILRPFTNFIEKIIPENKKEKEKGNKVKISLVKNTTI